MRVFRRVFLLAVGAIALIAAVLGALAVRDPEPRFRARHGELRSAFEQASMTRGVIASREVRLVSSSGLAVDLAMAWDDDLALARRPLVLIVGGHKTGRAAVDLIGQPRGTVIAAISYPFDGDHAVKGLAVVPAVPAIRRAILDTPPALLLALDYLAQSPLIDTTQIELVGVSLGAPFAVIAGAMDPRVSRVWSIHGAGEPYTLLAHNLRRRIPFAPARALVAATSSALISGPRLAPERWAPRIAPRRFVMVNALDDERIPRHAVETLWSSAGDPREMIWMPGRHVQGSRIEIVQKLVGIVFEHLDSRSR
jgi:hypothetical protein